MAGTQITQTRLPVTTDAGTKFQISATCTLAGTLPSVHMFVRQVQREDDPKDDVLLRVASVTDFTDYGTSREACISDRTFIYRINIFIQNYDTVTIANDAWKELSARVNTLVDEYDTYIGEFVTAEEGAVITYPTVDESTKAELISTYESTLDGVEALEDARSLHQVECEKKVYQLSQLQIRLTDVTNDVAALTPVVATLGVSVPVLQSVQGAIAAAQASANVSANNLASSADKTNIILQLGNIGTQLSLMSAELTALEDEVRVPLLALLGTLQTRLATLTSDLNALQVEAMNCQLELATAQAELDAARAQRDAALANIRGVCPDYVPEV
jgi:hypothetical protein